jgi:hypothetical protein
MAAVYVTNIVINSGADFIQSFDLANEETDSPLDLTGYEVNAQFRKWAGSSTSVSFGTTIIDPPNLGRILLTLSPEDTVSLKPGRYVYDILITDTYNEIKARVIEGMVLVREGVTR